MSDFGFRVSGVGVRRGTGPSSPSSRDAPSPPAPASACCLRWGFSLKLVRFQVSGFHPKKGGREGGFSVEMFRFRLRVSRGLRAHRQILRVRATSNGWGYRRHVGQSRHRGWAHIRQSKPKGWYPRRLGVAFTGYIRASCPEEG